MGNVFNFSPRNYPDNLTISEIFDTVIYIHFTCDSSRKNKRKSQKSYYYFRETRFVVINHSNLFGARAFIRDWTEFTDVKFFFF